MRLRSRQYSHRNEILARIITRTLKTLQAFLITFFTVIVSTICNEISSTYALKSSIQHTRYSTIIRSKMKFKIYTIFALAAALSACNAPSDGDGKPTQITILQTADIHG